MTFDERFLKDMRIAPCEIAESRNDVPARTASGCFAIHPERDGDDMILNHAEFWKLVNSHREHVAIIDRMAGDAARLKRSRSRAWTVVAALAGFWVGKLVVWVVVAVFRG